MLTTLLMIVALAYIYTIVNISHAIWLNINLIGINFS